MNMGQRINSSPQEAFIFMYMYLVWRILTVSYSLIESLDHYMTVKYLWNWCHKIIDASCFLLPATRLLSRPSPRMTKGNLIGYTTGGLPIYNFQTPQSVLTTVQSLLRQIVEQSESRQIFYFLCLNLVSSKFCRFLCSVGFDVFAFKCHGSFPLIFCPFGTPCKISISSFQCQTVTSIVTLEHGFHGQTILLS